MGRPGRVRRPGPYRRDGRGGALTEELSARRRSRADALDRRLRECFTEAASDLPEGERHGLALVAVGGFGRAEMSPFSDVDVVLVHRDGASSALVAQVAEKIWYPLWDGGVTLDHAVRSAGQMLQTADEDYRAALGMLDARAVAGDAAAVVALRSEILTAWRRTARRRLPELGRATHERVERLGWLAQSAVMDLKESGGGLRDGTVMRALVASWLVDVPHRELEALRAALLDVRDVLHEVAARPTDRLTPDLVPEVASVMGYAPDQLDLHVRDLGRRTAHLANRTWRRVDALLGERPRSRSAPGPRLDPVAPGVAVVGDEVVLTGSPDPDEDALVALHAVAESARRGLPLAAASAARLARGAVPPEPWPPEARRLLVEGLTAGRGLVTVWDEIDLAGLVDRWLPEWAPLRLRGSSSPVHRFTIDRHSVETAVVASGLMRTVARPDLLAVAALLHDVGKGREGDHSEVGAPIARAVATRWGFGEADADTIEDLVRRHLLLPTIATRRDIEDPDTAANVAALVGDADRLDLLLALTESDARATSPQAWSAWRSGLIRGLAAKVRVVLGDAAALDDPSYEGWPAGLAVPSRVLGDAPFLVDVAGHHEGSLVQVTAPDRHGLLADLAGALSVAGQQIRSARLVERDGTTTSIWEVAGRDVDEARLVRRIRQVLEGQLSLDDRLAPSGEGPTEPLQVMLHHDSSTSAVVEVRAQDQRGLVWAVARTITQEGYGIRSAHLSTFGPQARDVFYVVDGAGATLSTEQADALVERLRGLPL
ncbi:[protein-PII] uridylyltransferase [Mumia sp. zg.B17]|uniref:[protein-PII] uridylyltransferase n=1 Tax=Mumia sp. zg.B17 TaxID=2855446 RepID=UPI001C6DE773|nr:[protein-PII] uridylyltransferase [Mumia sp. zg.B17]MBW9205588.1 [protein-PII] uridylyltransferase [Mumia sp. zg.B17]